MRLSLAAGALALGLLTGCAPAAPSAPATTPTVTTAEHLAARRALGVPDCPPTGAPAPRADGLPNLILECLGGTSTVALAAKRERPLLVVVWGAWCAPCRDELPVLARALPEYDGRVDVLLVDFGELSYPAALSLLGETGATRWPVVVDPDRTLLARMNLQGVPRSFVVDPGGRIVDRHTGGYKRVEDVRASLAKAGVR